MKNDDKMIWSCLFHFGTHMWYDVPVDKDKALAGSTSGVYESLRFDEGVWREWTDAMVKGGTNMVVMDIGEGVKYPSHPELAIKGSWSADRLNEEVLRLKNSGWSRFRNSISPPPTIRGSGSITGWYRRLNITRSAAK